MKFSIITATYNSASSIRDTLHSIAEQDYPRDQIEWIVIDGASSDNTMERIRAESFQPAQVVSEPDQGIYEALNKGVRLATGDIIGFLHADDFYASTNVLSRVACAFGNTQAAAVYGDLQYVRQTTRGTFPVVRNWKSGAYHRNKIGWGWMPPHPALFIKREMYPRAMLDNGEYFRSAYTCAADYDFMMRLFVKHGIEPAYLKMVLVKMRTGGTSNRTIRHMIVKSREDWQVIRRNHIGHLHTLIWKNLRKTGQFFSKH